MVPVVRCAVVVLAFAAFSFEGCGGRGEGTGAGPGPATAPSSAAFSATPAPVPDAFRTLYQELERNLSEVRGHYAATQAIARPVVAAELLPANGNRGPELLQPGAMEGVRLYLDALKRLGAKAVNLSIAYPLFGDREPRRQEYVAFYRDVVAECRRRWPCRRR